MWITWKNTAADATGTISSSTELEADLELMLYAADVNTASGDAIDATAEASWGMKYYLQFMNPWETATGTNTDLSTIAYDAVIADITITTTTPSISGSGTHDTAVFTWTDSSTKAKDSYCPDSHTIASCTTDTTDNWDEEEPSSGNQCVETWALAAPTIRCVRMQATLKRKFHTSDANSEDIYFGYRPFMVFAGWEVASAVNAPLLMEFSGQNVDFGEFLRAEPEADYNSAITSLAITCASLTTAVLTFMF